MKYIGAKIATTNLPPRPPSTLRESRLTSHEEHIIQVDISVYIYIYLPSTSLNNGYKTSYITHFCVEKTNCHPLSKNQVLRLRLGADFCLSAPSRLIFLRVKRAQVGCFLTKGDPNKTTISGNKKCWCILCESKGNKH